MKIKIGFVMVLTACAAVLCAGSMRSGAATTSRQLGDAPSRAGIRCRQSKQRPQRPAGAVAIAGGRTAAGNAALVTHGKYLVTQVGMCGDCHTPMGPNGPDMQHWLQGGSLIFKPTVPVPGWAAVAPGIAGLPAGWSHADTVRFLQTGVLPKGAHSNPPMPQVRLNHHDADAVAAYLASLPSGRKEPVRTRQ